MAITETSRHEMLIALESQIGEEATMTLAEHLPPVGWADVATRADIEGLAAVTRADVERLAADIDRLEAATRADFERLEASIRADMKILAAELRAETLSLEVRMADRFNAQTRNLVLSLLATMLTIVGMDFIGPS